MQRHTAAYLHIQLCFSKYSAPGLIDPLYFTFWFSFLCNLLSSSYQSGRNVISCCRIFYPLSKCFVQTPVKRAKSIITVRHFKSCRYCCYSGKSLRKMCRKIDIFACYLYFSFVLDFPIKFSVDMCIFLVYVCSTALR